MTGHCILGGPARHAWGARGGLEVGMRVVIVDGVPSLDGAIRLDADDPGLTLGMCVFETMRTFSGQLFRGPAHLARLVESARAFGAPCPLAEIQDEIAAALAAFGAGEANVRVTLSVSGRRIVRAQTLTPQPGLARCVTRPGEPNAALPGWIKHTSRAVSALALAASGATEVLWVDGAGLLLEGTRCNVIGVVGGALITPPLDGRILAGVTRGALLEAARGLGLPVREEPVPAVTVFDELYLCSTLRDLQPVVELDGRAAPGAGPVGAAALEAFTALVRSETALSRSF